MTRHASSTCSADLRYRPNGLRIMLINGRPNLMLGDIQAMTHRPTGGGMHGVFDESLRVTEVHGEHSSEGVRWSGIGT